MARRGTSREIGRGTPIFSFETSSRERSRSSTNRDRSARELIRDITGSDHSPSHSGPSSTSMTPTGTPSRQNNSTTTPLSVNNAVNHIPPPTPLTNNSVSLNGSTETTQTRLLIRRCLLSNSSSVRYFIIAVMFRGKSGNSGSSRRN